MLSLAAATLALLPLQDVTLKVGDPAPPLEIATWVKGEPVAGFEEGTVYVVEFWATWCGPCIAGMPHLSELQATYADRGLRIIGVSSEDSRGNSLEGVRAMVADKGETMAYTVAWDEGRRTNTAYMKAAGRNGIPCCFVVDGAGKIAYVGHPMWLDLPLEEIYAGTWDAVSGARMIAEVEKRFGSLFRIKDSKEALAAMDSFCKDYPAFAHHADEPRMRLHLRSGEYEKAYAVMGRLVDKAIHQKNAALLNGYAWSVVDPRADLAERNLDLALRAAEAANEFTHSKDPAILDTLARVHFLRGDVETALELQRRAVELAPGTMKPGLLLALKEYEAAAGQAGR